MLIAGLGNLFFGDDAFGVEVARRLQRSDLPAGVSVRDFGIRSLDLAYELADIDVLILVDAVSRGGPPGTVYVIELATDSPAHAGLDAHGLEPGRVWSLAAQIGSVPKCVFLVGCEVAHVGEGLLNLSEPVARAVDEAVGTVRELVTRLLPKAVAHA